MRKKFSFFIAIGLLMLLLVPSIGVVSDIDENIMKPGDTFLYSVTEFDIPWQDLLGDMGLAGFSFEDLIIDLAGSTFAVKVMATDNNAGFYALNSYVILGKDIEVPFPEGTPSDITEIFGGEKLVIPEGVGLGIGQMIPGSDYLKFISEDFGTDPGFPFYFDPNEWDQYEEMFMDLEDLLIGMNYDIEISTSRENGEFIVALSGHVGEGALYTDSTDGYYSTETTETWWETSYPPYTTESTEIPSGWNPDVDVTLEIAWHETGKYEGIFKRVKGQLSGDLVGNDNVLDMNVEVSFKEKRYNPLPKEIEQDNRITIVMDSAEFNYDATGFILDQPEIIAQFDYYVDEVGDMVGDDIFEFEISDVDGCFYETTINQYQQEDIEGVWWNGFSGNPSYLDVSAEGPWSDWTFYDTTGIGGIIPFAAPGITPDWDMWRASVLSISSYLEVIEATVTSSSAQTDLADIGMTVDTFDITYEMRASNDYKVFYFSGEVDIEWDTAGWADWPMTQDPERPYADVVASIEAWLMYTDEGLIVGIGLDISLDANLEDMPLHTDYVYNETIGEYVPVTFYDDATLSLDLKANLRNNDYEELPDPTALPEDTKGEAGDGAGITPGFSVIPMLLVLAIVAVIVKRRK
ncbi:MAG: hypothetical protein ACFFB2_09590 [Promethearchaeota archaeon]